MPAATATMTSPNAIRKSGPAEKKYKCQYCHRAFSRSEHRSRHERSHTKERPFKCNKCRSTFVRRDLLLRHDRTVHAKDNNGGGHDSRRRSGPKTAQAEESPPPPPPYRGLSEVAHQLNGTDVGSDEMSLEAAAALMTGLHHKAMASQEPELAGAVALSALSPTGPSFPDHRQTYAPETVALPQMPWDSLVPQGVSQANGSNGSNGHTMPSQSGMRERTPFSFGPDHPNTLPPILDQTSTNGEFPPVHGPLSLSDIPSPGAMSPFPLMVGPVSPVDYRRSPGPSQPLTVRKAPQVEAEYDCAKILENIKKCDSEVALLETFRLPSRTVLNHYLSTYFDFFHHHLPFLHPASFDPTEVAAPLLLAVLSIGALYTGEEDQAFMLHIGSKVLVNQFLQKKDNYSSRKCPLWTMQSTLLNMVFASWSGDPKGLEWACSIKSLLANMVAGNRYELKLRVEAREGRQPSHAEWIEDEGCRRSYYAVYIFFGLLTLTFNHTPAISFNELDSLELPSSESLWTMESSEEEAWRENISSNHIMTFCEAHDKLFGGEMARYSAFATRVLIGALFLEVWYHKRSPDALQDVVTGFRLRLALEAWKKSLDLCEPETVVVKLNAPHQGHPLIFNSMAMFRNTNARLVVDLKSVQEALRYHDAYEVAAAMTNARDKIDRSSEMLKVIQECFECIELAASQGVRWVARVSATEWSVEHPLCGLDLIVILSLWLWRIEHDEEPATEQELEMYQRLRALFTDDCADKYADKLSSTVSRLWGCMLDKVVVWGITKIIGESFKLHAQALVGYEDSLLANPGETQNHTAGPGPAHEVRALEMQAAY